MNIQRRRLSFSSLVLPLLMLWTGIADGFVTNRPNLVSKSFVTKTVESTKTLESPGRKSNTELNMFMGSDGGILGIGTPELFTILLVGYFVLGPSDLYKLTKEIGKFVQNVRTFSAEATSTLENSMESQLQLEEIRKAQRELNDAFNFRRSINVDEDSEAFEVNAQSPRQDTAPVATVTDNETDASKPKKKIRRRRVKKKKVEEEQQEEEPPFCVPGSEDNTAVVNNVPDLDLEDDLAESEKRMMDSLAEAKEELRREQMEAEAAEQSEGYSLSASDEQSRFQAQMSGNWNEQILSKETELGPMADIMERLAILEEEKNAADARLQEEFRLREENEERFYREKRQILEEAAARVQANAYETTGPASENANNNNTL